MNHIYRLVWNHATSAWVAVSETARTRSCSKPGRASRRGARALLALYGLSMVQWAHAASPTVVLEAGKGNRAYVSANGATVVDIAKANAAGVSHNKFTRYDVGDNGLVLNNTTSKKGATSALAGSVGPNLYAPTSAGLIVNEVTSTRRSVLSGFTEVAGKKADVVVVNPNGITCDGCGFVNTDRVTLATGTTQWNQGALSGISVSRGDILITGNGANASAQKIFDLVTRSIKIDGNINAKALAISAGTQNWNYATRTATATAAKSDAPSYAIDSTVLGGMYADSIRLIATENGVGVRALGDVAAKASDVVISAAGQVDLRNHTSAARDVNVATTQALTMDGSAVIAKRTISLSGTSIAADNALVFSEGNASVKATSGNVQLNNTTLRATDTATLIASNNLTVSATDDRGVQSTAGDIVLRSGGVMQLSGNVSAGGNATLNSGANLNNTGLVQAQGAMTLSSGALLDNRGAMLARGALSAEADTVSNEGDMQGASVRIATRALANTGTLVAKAGTATLTIDDTLSNLGLIQASSHITARKSGGGAMPQFDNQGDVIAGGNLSINAATLANARLLSAGGALNLAINSFSNTADSEINSTGNATITIAGAALNQGLITSAGDLSFTAAGLTNASGATLRGGTGLELVLTGHDLDNSGLLQAGLGTASNAAPLYITASNISNNASGKIEGGLLVVDAGTLDNYGKITGTAGSSSIVLSGSLNNDVAGEISLGNAGSGTNSIDAHAINNLGVLQSGASLSLTSTSLNNAEGAKLLSGADLYMNGQTTIDLVGQVNAQAGLRILDAGTVNLTGSARADAVTVTADNLNMGAQAVLMSQNNMDIDVVALTMQEDGADTSRILGSMEGTAGTRTRVNVTGAGTLSVPGMIFSGNDLHVSAAHIDITAGGALAAQQDLVVRANAGGLNLAAATPDASAGNLSNLGLIYAGRNMSLFANGTLTNAIRIDGTGAGRTIGAQGTIYAEGNLDIIANTVVNNSDILSNNDIRIVAATFRNEVQGGDTRRISSNYVDWPEHVAAEHPDDRDWAPSGWILKPGDQTWDDGGAGGVNDEARNVVRYYDVTTAFEAGTEPLYWPTLTGKNIKLYFNNGSNLGGLIEGTDSVLLQGFAARTSAGGGTVLGDLAGVQDAHGHVLVQAEAGATDMARFTNNSLAQVTEHHTIQRTQTDKDADGDPWSWCDAGSDDVCNGYPGNWERGSKTRLDWVHATTPILPAGYSGARIYTASLSGQGFSFYNEGSIEPAAFDPGAIVSTPGTRRIIALPGTGTPPSTVLPGTGTQTGWTPVSTDITPTTTTTPDGRTLQTGLSFGGINIRLPANANGLYVLATDPNADYLIERNPLFGLDSAFGSNYLLELLGFSTDDALKRLGDASYETWLIRQQMIAQTGRMLLQGFASMEDMVKALMNNAADQSKTLGLAWGTALTPEQQAGLKSDMVWMVKTTVNGQEVLTPIVYLSQTTKDSIQKGAIVQAGSGNLTVHGIGDSGTVTGLSITNAGGGTAQNSLSLFGPGQSFSIVKSYLLGTSGGSIGISDVTTWIGQNKNNPEALGKVMPFAYERFMSLAIGNGVKSDSDRAFVSAVAEYAKAERLAAIDKALAEYRNWKAGPKIGQTRGLLTSMVDLGESPPDSIMQIAKAGITWKDEAQAARLGAMLAGAVVGAGAAGGATAAVGTANIYVSVATAVARGAATSITAVGGVASAAASFAAAAAIAGQAVAKIISDKNFEKKLLEKRAEFAGKSATDFSYWFGMDGGQEQMALAMSKMMGG